MMKITKMTRWRVFAGVWIQSLFTSATAFFCLFPLPLTSQFGWSSHSAWRTPFNVRLLRYFMGGLLRKAAAPRGNLSGPCLFAAWFLTIQFCLA